jgi:hypothetical protein
VPSSRRLPKKISAPPFDGAGYKAIENGEERQLQAMVDSIFVEHIGRVMLDCLFADQELFCDLQVCLAGHYQDKYSHVSLDETELCQESLDLRRLRRSLQEMKRA